MRHHPDSQPRSPRSPSEWDDYFDLRWRILRAPWNQPRGSEKDDREDAAVHLMVVAPDSLPLAIGRLHFNTPTEAQVRFMAVEPRARSQGLGGRILEELENRARAAGATSIILNAREDAERFYQAHGFTTTGPAPTMFDAIKHVRMTKDLTGQAG